MLACVHACGGDGPRQCELSHSCILRYLAVSTAEQISREDSARRATADRQQLGTRRSIRLREPGSTSFDPLDLSWALSAICPRAVSFSLSLSITGKARVASPRV